MNETGLEGIQDQLPLGQSAGQPEQYDPSLLVGVPRGLARGVEGIDASLFEGHDLWNCWEVSKRKVYLIKTSVPVELGSNSLEKHIAIAATPK